MVLLHCRRLRQLVFLLREYRTILPSPNLKNIMRIGGGLSFRSNEWGGVFDHYVMIDELSVSSSGLHYMNEGNHMGQAGGPISWQIILFLGKHLKIKFPPIEPSCVLT